jgi:hypothetical protein
MHSDGVDLIIQKRYRVLMAINMAFYIHLSIIVIFNLMPSLLQFDCIFT